MAKNRQILFIIIFSIGFLISGQIISAQSFTSLYLVSFKNKTNTPFQLDNPSAFLGTQALERRAKANIAIDSTDLPIPPSYLDSLKSQGMDVLHQSKWLNAALVLLYDSAQIRWAEQSPLIDSIAFMAPFTLPKQSTANQHKMDIETTPVYTTLSQYPANAPALDMINLGPLMDMSFDGKNIHIAVFDNGFWKANTMNSFSSLFQNGQLRDTLNFTTDARSIFSLGSHGTAVLSTLCGHIPNQYIGSAMGAEYSLFVTEDTRFELPVEEANWLFAAEYADSMGVDIITSSLAYSTFDLSQYDHNHLQLDGKTAIISRAAQLASDKGILVLNAAANEGNKPWRKICFPADAQGVFSIGSVDSKRQYSSFSSVGNTTDGRIKPNVAALGTAAYIINGSDEVVQSNGTSFSTPLMAGAAATLMQAAPHKTAQEIQQALMQSASQYLHPDSLLGYGIPDLYLAYLLLQEEGIDKLAQGKITAIPNPFVQRFHLLYQSFGSEKINLNIFDYSGKLVWKKENITTQEGNNLYLIDGVSQLAQGNYILELRSNTQRLSLKLVKE